MKVLVISDTESELLKNHYKENHMDETDLILSAGDLPYNYIQDVKANIHAKLYYVRGNHDTFKHRFFDKELIEWKCVEFYGITIAGIGRRNRNGKALTETDLKIKINTLSKKIQKAGGADIIISHYPAAGYGDGTDTFHKGSAAIRDFILNTEPKYFIYGHNHLNYRRNERIINTEKTVFINAYEKYMLEF